MQLVNEMITQLDYPFFKDDYEMIAIDLSKHLELDAGLKAMQQKKKKKKKKKKLFRIFVRDFQSIVDAFHNFLCFNITLR